MRKLNKFISTFIALVITVSTLPVMPSIAKAETFGDYTYSITNEKAHITGYSGSDTELYIPDEIDGYPVVCISSSAFAGNTTLKYVAIPDTVTTIGEYAFNKCTRLSTIDISESVKYINTGAFSYCSALENILLPSGLTYINKETFYSCKALKSINIPNGVTKIDDDAFAYCYYLSSIEIPNSVTTIGNRSFLDCMRLTSVKLSQNLQYIYAHAFQDCSVLVDIELPDSLRKLSGHAFRGCLNLAKIRIPSKITVIDDYTFASCYKLSEVEIPNSVTSIDYYAFFKTKVLTQITIPSTVTSIDADAFNSSALNTIYGYSNSYAETFANNKNITFIALDRPNVNESDLEINGYQMNTSIGGVRVIYSAEPTINNLEVVERGLLLGLKDYATEEDMVIEEESDYVISSAATANGLATYHHGTSDTSTSYVMTFTQNIDTMSTTGLSANYYVRAYALLSDGTYVYSDINTYSIFSVAKELYDNQMMNQLEKHVYLYDNILSVVDVNYASTEFSYTNTLG